MGLGWHSPAGGSKEAPSPPPPQEASGWTPENVALLLGSFGTIITQLDRIATALETGYTPTDPIDVIPDCVLVTESGAYLVDEAGNYVLQDCEIPEGALVDEAGAYLVNNEGLQIVTEVLADG